MSGAWSLQHFYHTVINVRDLDESVAFYRLLGWEVLNDRRNVEWPDFVATLFGMTRAKGKGVLMNLPADPDGPMLDLIQWIEPEEKFPPVPLPEGAIPRIIAFRTKNVHAAYAALKAEGVRFTREMFSHAELGVVGSCFCWDPNGNIIELIELNPGQRHSKANEALSKT
ncbi:MAG: VOC family protein [Alphaproteobacteria bacterium]|nr:VOC family protein [Alphaproteobacteria bacterium]